MDRWSQAIEANEIKVRKNAVRGIEVFMGYSPDAEISVEQWNIRTKTWLAETFGSANILQFDLHLDETTPHAQAIIVPITPDGRLTAKHWLGGKGKLAGLQTDFWKSVGEPLGLERGVEGSSRKHIPLAEMHNRLAYVKDSPTPEVEKPPLTGRADYQADLQTKVDKLHKAAMVATAHGYDQRKLRIQQTEIAAASKKLNKELTAKIAEHKAEVARLKYGITPAMVLESHGYEEQPKKSHTETQFKGEAGHFSVSSTGLWSHEWQKDAGGKSVIDLEMFLAGCDFKTALARLKTQHGADLTAHTVGLEQAKKQKTELAIVQVVPPLEMQSHKWKQDESKWAKAKAYLMGRAIPEPLIDGLKNAGRIWANAWGSVCFGCFKASKGERTLAGIQIRGIYGDFKQHLGDKSVPFGVGSQNAPETPTRAICESAIDALSLNALSGMECVSYGGLCWNEKTKTKITHIAFDADAAGEKATLKLHAELKEAGRTAEVLRPRGRCKDWNQMLAEGFDMTGRRKKERSAYDELMDLPDDLPPEKPEQDRGISM